MATIQTITVEVYSYTETNDWMYLVVVGPGGREYPLNTTRNDFRWSEREVFVFGSEHEAAQVVELAMINRELDPRRMGMELREIAHVGIRKTGTTKTITAAVSDTLGPGLKSLVKALLDDDAVNIAETRVTFTDSDGETRIFEQPRGLTGRLGNQWGHAIWLREVKDD